MRKCLLVFTAIAAVSAGSLFAEERTFEDGFYVGAGGIVTTLGGDFDGKTFFYDSYEIIAVPEADTGLGIEGLCGYRSEKWALELVLAYSGAKGHFGTDDYDLKRLQFGLGLKFFPLVESKYQPFLSVGFGGDSLTAVDASINADDERGDAIYTGIDFRIGGGLAVYVTPHFAVNFKAEFVYASFSDGEGVEGVKKEIDPTLKGGGFAGGVFVTYTF